MREMPFQRPEISKFPGGACPRTPLGARAYGARRLAPLALDHTRHQPPPLQTSWIRPWGTPNDHLMVVLIKLWDSCCCPPLLDLHCPLHSGFLTDVQEKYKQEKKVVRDLENENDELADTLLASESFRLIKWYFYSLLLLWLFTYIFTLPLVGLWFNYWLMFPFSGLTVQPWFYHLQYTLIVLYLSQKKNFFNNLSFCVKMPKGQDKQVSISTKINMPWDRENVWICLWNLETSILQKPCTLYL